MIWARSGTGNSPVTQQFPGHTERRVLQQMPNRGALGTASKLGEELGHERVVIKASGFSVRTEPRFTKSRGSSSRQGFPVNAKLRKKPRKFSSH